MYSEAPQRKLIWDKSADNGIYQSHRIPGIVVTKKDTVIIYCDGRRESHDWAPIDIYMQRSTDHGETFGERIYLAQGTQEHPTVNNAVLIVDDDNTLHCLFCRDYSICATSNAPADCGGLWYRRSTDDGLTWSEPRRITDYFPKGEDPARYEHNAFAFGPGHGICTSAGVLLVPCWFLPRHKGLPLTSHGIDASSLELSTMYSLDHGETWQMSTINGGTNETMAAELSDGRILLNSRVPGYRRIVTSPNGYSDWSSVTYDTALIDPGCFGALQKFDLPGKPHTILFSNCESTTGRVPLVLKASVDDCASWKASYVLDDRSGGYSDIAVDSRGCIYVLYEQNFGHRVYLTRLSYDTVLGQDGVVLDDLRIPDAAAPFAFRSAWGARRTVMAENGQESLTLLPTAKAGLTVTVNGEAIPTAVPTAIPLDVTRATQELRVTVASGDRSRTYYLVVTYKDSLALHRRLCSYAEQGAVRCSGEGTPAAYPALPLTRDDFTFSLWFTPAAFPPVAHLFWHGGPSASDTTFYARITQDNGIAVALREENTEVATMSATLGTPLQVNTRYHLVVSRRGAAEYLYLSGRRVASKSLSYEHDLATALPLYLGYDKNGARHFIGTLDHIALYNYCMEDDEVAALTAGEK